MAKRKSTTGSRGTPATVKALGPRPGAAPWSPPARKVKLATKDPRRKRG
jgi:hypothetical protein